MNPRNTYKSLANQSSVVKILALILFTQLALFLLGKLSFSLPNFITTYATKLIFEDQKLIVKCDSFKFSPKGEITFYNLKISQQNQFEIKCKRGQIILDYNQFIDNRRKFIKSLSFKDVNILTKEINEEAISINHLLFESTGKNIYCVDANLNALGHNITSNGIIEQKRSFEVNGRSKVNLSRIFKEMDNFFRNHSESITKFCFQNSNIKITDNDSSILFVRIENAKKISKEDSTTVFKDVIIDASSDHYLSNFQSIASFSFVKSNDTQNILINKVDAKIEYTRNKNSKYQVSTLLNLGKTELGGKIKGFINPFDLVFKISSASTSLQLIKYDKSIESCLTLKSTTNKRKLEGFANLNPNHLDLEFFKNDEYLKIASGDSLKFRVNHNLASTDPSFETLFTVSAKSFSALESPSGNYDFIGEIKDDLSIEIRKAFGIMGQSEVRGSYSQSWNPHAYEFRLAGNCFPPDINNWLGNWWCNLWDNFSFNQEIPFGDFRIKGIWGGEIGNSRTIGFVDSGLLNYKGFTITNADIEVEVDSNSTKIKSDNIVHDKGSLAGSLTFPRKHLNSPVFLSFQIDGQYPLNDARTIFGESFERTVEDINATTLFCNATGEILNKQPDTNSNSNFNLDVQSIDPFTIKGFEINKIYGSINKSGYLTTGNFPSIKIADGQGQLYFETEANGTEELVNLNFSLKDANKGRLIKNIIRAKEAGIFSKFKKEQSEIDLEKETFADEGSLSFAIQAEGPLNNPLQFEGTGTIHLRESKIGQINLLGKISEGLSNLKIPLPSGAFSFNELLIPFELNNESIIFDNLNLSGPLSKIQAKGNFNLSTQTIDLIAKLSLVGNLPLPIIKNLLQLADPISNIAEIKMTGNYLDPKWELILSNN